MSNSAGILAILALVGLSWMAAPSSAAEIQLAASQQTQTGSTPRPDTPATVNLWQPGDPGQPLHIHGWVTSTDGKPLGGATLLVWQADGNGMYHDDRYRTTLRTGNDGSYRFNTVLPGQYYGVKHIHVIVAHEAHQALETRILFKGDPNLDEAVASQHAIHLEEATVKGKTVLIGRFDVTMRGR